MGMVKYLQAVEIAEGRPDPLPPPPPPPPPSAASLLKTDERKPEPLPPPTTPPCARVDCGELGNLEKHCGKCLVTCYCFVECQREDWPAHKKQCKLNRKFELREQTEEVRATTEKAISGYRRPSVPGTLRASLTPSTQPDLRRHVTLLVAVPLWPRINFGFYFDRIFAGNDDSGERYRSLFE